MLVDHILKNFLLHRSHIEIFFFHRSHFEKLPSTFTKWNFFFSSITKWKCSLSFATIWQRVFEYLMMCRVPMYNISGLNENSALNFGCHNANFECREIRTQIQKRPRMVPVNALTRSVKLISADPLVWWNGQMVETLIGFAQRRCSLSLEVWPIWRMFIFTYM